VSDTSLSKKGADNNAIRFLDFRNLALKSGHSSGTKFLERVKQLLHQDKYFLGDHWAIVSDPAFSKEEQISGFCLWESLTKSQDAFVLQNEPNE
jgi:hypothetical protein